MLDPKDPRETQEPKVILDLMDLEVTPAIRERREHVGPMETKEHQVQLDSPEKKDHRELRDRKEKEERR